MIDTGDGPVQRKLIGGIGILAALVLIVVSGTMNFLFGFNSGKTLAASYVYGAAAAAADCFKAICPFIFFAAWRNRQWSVAAGAAIVCIVVVAYALAGAAGHAGSNRQETAGERELAATNYKDLRGELKSAQDRLGFQPKARGFETVKVEIEANKTKNLNLWNHSSECTEPAGKAQREFCTSHLKLNSELASAKETAEIEKEIKGIKAKLAGAKGTDAAADADPQAGSINRILQIVGISASVLGVQDGLTVLVVLLIEVGSTFGLYIAVAYFRGVSGAEITPADYRHQPPKAVEQPQGQGQADQISSVPLITDARASQQPIAEPAVQEPPMVLRARLPGADGALRSIGIPYTGDRKGPLLNPLPGREAADALVQWIRAHDLARADLSSEQISEYDAECCQMRHRRQTLDSDVKEALPRIRGVEKGRPKQPDGSRPVRYAIKPGKYPKPEPQATPEPAEAKQEGGKVFAFGRRPLAVAPEMAQPINSITLLRRAA